MARQKLNFNFDELFPGDTIEIGTQVVDIKPLSIAQLAVITRKLKGYGDQLKKAEITWDNYNSPENLLTITTTLLDKFPEVLEEGSNIDVEYLKRLPIEVVVQIIDKVVTVNLKSRESLAKNFKGLMEKVNVT